MNHEQKTRVVQQLSFLKGDRWLVNLKNKIAPQERSSWYRTQLKPADAGLGWCIDERGPRFREDKHLKPAYVAGAEGWRMTFMLVGKSFDEAGTATSELYRDLGWGQREAHTDDHMHVDPGEKPSPGDIKERNLGCGALAKKNDVAEIVLELLGDEIPQLQSLQTAVLSNFTGVSSEQHIADLRKKGGKIVPLTGDHKTAQAHVVVNFVPGKTLDRVELFDQHPAFVWDAWATIGGEVLAKFNELAETNLSAEQFLKLQIAMHLVTGLLLNAVRLEGDQKNLVILENSQVQ